MTADEIVALRLQGGIDTSKYVAKPTRESLIEDAQRIFDLEYDQIRDMSASEAIASAFVLKQYAVFLGGEICKINLILQACEDGINAIHAVCMKRGEFEKYMSRELQRAQVINENSQAQGYEKLRRKAADTKLMSQFVLDDVHKMSDLLGSKRYGS
jgi:hypothetical protein